MNLPYLINLGKEGDKVYLVIAEKPDLATDIAKAILTQNIEKKPWGYCGVGSREYAIISAFGHLMELEKPENYNPKYKQWSLEDLPMMFPDWKIVPSQEPYKKERLKEIGKLLKSCEAVVHAGDPDEEGQLLIDEILQYFSCEKPVFRVLINDNLPKNIRKEFENLKENIEFLNIGKSANARRMADMCFGINESRLACLKLQRKGLSIGRVQTPTLGLVVRRDEAIKNHKKESNDKSSTNVSENTCEDIPDTSIPDTSISDTSISDTCVADTNTPDTSTSEADILDTTYEDNKEQFYISEIPDNIFEKMQGKSYKADCTLPRENLRYIHVLHVGFDNQVHEGELVVNKDIADDVLEIFKELYEAGYQIEKVRLVDEYDADDEASMSDNNSSAFNFRFISHTTKISKHGMGMAVDINTLYNPYVKTVDGELSIEPANAADYVDRSKDFSHKIDHDDLCYKLFTEHGFEWGGDWTHSKDYQHFEK